MGKKFNSLLKEFDPNGQLTREKEDILRKFYNAGWDDALGAMEGRLKIKPVVEETIDYLNKCTGRRFKASEGTIKLISPRIRSGYTLEDFKKVIDYAVESWTGTKFEQYIKPQTLFGSDEKVAKYLDLWESTCNKPSGEQVITKDIKNGGSLGFQDIAF